MKTFLKLIKISLNQNFGVSALKYQFFKEKKGRWKPFVIGLSIILGFLPLMAMYSFMLYGIFYVGQMINEPEIVLTFSFVFGQIIILVFGIYYIMSSFYFSKDISILIPLPLRPYQIIGSKFVVILVNEMLTAIPIFLPAVIIYGTGTGQGLLYWFKSILIMLALPSFPLILDSLIVMILMRFVNLRRSKDLFAILGGIVSIAFAIGINVFTQRIPWEEGQSGMENFLLGNMGLMETIGRAFPPSIWATNALAKPAIEGLLYFLLSIGSAIVLFGLLLWLANRIFYKSVLAGQESTRKRKTLSANKLNEEYKRVSSPVVAIFKKEWKLLMRTPVYVLNGLVGVIIGPLIVLIMLSTNKQNSETDIIFKLIENPDMELYVTLIGIGFMLFVSGMNVVASTSLSREGQTFWISKVIPISPRLQVKAKLLHAVAISVIGIIFTGIIFVVFLKFSLARSILMMVISVLGAIPLAALGLLIDIIQPKLVWNNPQEAIKQNINAFFAMLAAMLLIGILAGVAFGLVALKVPEWVLYIILILVIAILSIPSLFGLYSAADNRYYKIEA